MKSLVSLLLACLCWASAAAMADTPGQVGIGAPLRDVPMQGLLGPSRLLSEFRGKPLVINVWASWCGPCRQEMGSLERLNRRYGGKQFNVIGVSTDDYPDRAVLFVKLSGASFSNYIDSKLVLEHMLGAERLPLTLLVDANGRVLARYFGAHEWDSPEAVAIIGKAFRTRL